MLTQRAQSYLASLKRVRPVPAEELERVLKEKGVVRQPAWLEFQEQYAGYVEPLGADEAIWGILHENSRWIPPGEVDIEQAKEEGAESFVTCAEVHRSYVYQLANTGRFREPSAESFDVKVERNALRVEFASAPGFRAEFFLNVRDQAFLEQAARETAVVPEGSDLWFEVLLGETIFALRDPDSKEITQALIRKRV